MDFGLAIKYQKNILNIDGNKIYSLNSKFTSFFNDLYSATIILIEMLKRFSTYSEKIKFFI